jgi:hypothetical protein
LGIPDWWLSGAVQIPEGSKRRQDGQSRHYIHIATALEMTIVIQEEIDVLYPEVEKDVIDFP